jgi:putative endonuclease
VSGWVVYILECGDRSLYTGVAIDLERRLQAHQAGTASKYTRARQPCRLVFTEAHPSRSSAQRREAAIKRLPRSAKLALVRAGASVGGAVFSGCRGHFA